jgi:hypothetical protein
VKLQSNLLLLLLLLLDANMNSLRVLSYNVQRSKDGVMATLLRDDKVRQSYDVIAIQEPWENSFKTQRTTQSVGNL